MDKVQLGPWVFIPSEYSISDGATHTELEPLLSKLLLYFVEQPGKIVSRQQLVDTIWQQSYVDDNAINRAISELRKALQHPQLPHSPIKTHHRKGYSFQLPLLSNTDVTNNNDVAPGQLTQAQTNTVSLQQSHRSAIWLGILSITLVFIIGMLWYRFAPEPTLTTQIQETSSRPQIVELDIINQQKITWYKGIQSRPLLSPDKQLLAYSHSQPDGAIRVLIRKLGTSAGTILQEVAIESSVAHNSVQNWQPQSRKLLIQVVSKDGNQCEYQQYDFNEYPQYQVTTLSQCSGFVLGVAQVSLDGQWLYYSKNSGGMHTSNALVAENLITGAVQTLQAAQSAGLGVTMLALSADGSKLAYILMPESNKPDIYLYDPASREHSLVVSLPFPMLFMGLEWSIDQTSLILPGADSIVQFNLADKSRTLFKLPAGVKVGELSLLSDNQAYISALTANSATEGGMQLVKVNQAFNDSERQIRFVTDVAGSSMALAVSPTDAKQYAFSANWTGGWQLWLNTNGQNIQLTELPNDPQLINHISWSGNGRYIAFTQQGNLYLYDIQRQQLINKLENNDVGHPVWMPDNSGLVLTRVQANSQNLWQLDLVSKDLTQLTFSAGNVAQYDSEEQLLYHRDGKLFQYVDGARQDIEIKVNEQSLYNALWLHQTDYQYRFSMLGHVEQFNVLTGETRQTQLPHQLIGIHPDPHNPDILYATVFVTPELALEFMEWQPKTEVPN